MKRATWLTSLFLAVCISLFRFMIPIYASSAIMTEEIRLAAATGQFIQIVQAHEQQLIESHLQSYFEPFIIENEALQFAEIIQEELKRYHSNILQRLNVRFYLVKANANIAGLTLTSKDHTSCLIYLAQENSLAIQQVRQTLHHEIFHCYDQQESIISWSQRFIPATHIIDLWGTITDEVITIDYAAEERAEYFASIVTGNSQQLEKDPSYELKQQVLLSDLYTLIRDQTIYPRLRTYFIRNWQDGRIITIQEVTVNSLLVRTYEFDFRTSSCIITNYLTNMRTVMNMT